LVRVDTNQGVGEGAGFSIKERCDRIGRQPEIMHRPEPGNKRCDSDKLLLPTLCCVSTRTTFLLNKKAPLR